MDVYIHVYAVSTNGNYIDHEAGEEDIELYTLVATWCVRLG